MKIKSVVLAVLTITTLSLRPALACEDGEDRCMNGASYLCHCDKSGCRWQFYSVRCARSSNEDYSPVPHGTLAGLFPFHETGAGATATGAAHPARD